jgi:hypothetical protein
MKNPKEKAHQIAHQMYKTANISERQAAICSLICIDEIINAIDFDWMQVQNLDREHAYWQQVKTEINLL